MAVFYKKTEKRNPQSPSDPKKWYCVLRRIRKATTKEVSEAASRMTSASPKEIEMAIIRSFQEIAALIRDGRSVEIDGFGTFRLTVKSQGVATKKELNANAIVKGNLRFVPSIELKELIAKIEYIDVDEFSKKAGSNNKDEDFDAEDEDFEDFDDDNDLQENQ